MVLSEILQNPLFLAVLTIVCGAVISWYIYLREKKHKKIAYKILSNTSLLSVKEEIKKDVKITFKDKPVKQVQLILLRIICSGNMPIRPKDYDEQLSINLGKDVQILSAEIIESKPENRKVPFSIEGTSIVFGKILLNQSETFTLKILASKIGNEIKVEGHIAGVTIEKAEDNPKLTPILILGGTIFSFGGYMIYVIKALLDKSPYYAETLLVLAGGIIIALIGVYIENRNKKKLQKELEILTTKTVTEEIQ